jgi:hypothetical protein
MKELLCGVQLCYIAGGHNLQFSFAPSPIGVGLDGKNANYACSQFVMSIFLNCQLFRTDGMSYIVHFIRRNPDENRVFIGKSKTQGKLDSHCYAFL